MHLLCSCGVCCALYDICYCSNYCPCAMYTGGHTWIKVGFIWKIDCLRSTEMVLIPLWRLQNVILMTLIRHDVHVEIVKTLAIITWKLLKAIY